MTACRGSMPRLNSAAPYRMQACPPISRARTFFRRKVERTLGIGLGFTRPSQEQERGPEALRFDKPFGRRERIPFLDFIVPHQRQRRIGTTAGQTTPVRLHAKDSN